MTHLEDYAERYRFVRFERRDGILQMTIHENGGPARWSAYPGGIHEELGDAFYQVGRDRENRVIILTGAGDTFCTKIDFDEPDPDGIGAKFWDRIYKEGKDLLHNLLDIEVPVIGAVNGPAFIHAELITMSDIVLAAEHASFADKAHFPAGTVPGDGVHIWWPMLLGPNRGRHFLLTGDEISASEAKALGFVAEVLPRDQLLDRAWEVARGLLAKHDLTLRFTRAAFTQHIKRRMLDDLGYGLMLEGMGIVGAFGGK
jgi:enoyl-CoA hydratase/carnithine racemase